MKNRTKSDTIKTISDTIKKEVISEYCNDWYIISEWNIEIGQWDIVSDWNIEPYESDTIKTPISLTSKIE